jgi:hypothetical protein
MTKQQATFKAREIAKQSVRNYFNSQPTETFNWEQFGSKIIKKELHHAFKLYVPYWNMLTQKWCVMLLNGNKIIAE